jgi:site-specific recombinase XerD
MHNMKMEDIGTEQETPRYINVETGIYKYTANGTYHERPSIGGKRTWRSLGVNFTPQKNLKLAREEYHRRRSAESEGKSPYAEPEEAKTAASTVGDVIRKYQVDGYLDRDLQPRPPGTLADEERHCNTLIEFWEPVAVAAVTDAACDRYRDWRKERVQQGNGDRAIDRELNTLNNAFRYCKRREVVSVNPLADRPRYQPSSKVHHCREFMPDDAEELHGIAALLFENPHSRVLGFQMLFEANTGLRSSEILKWGADKFGTTTADGRFVHVWRCKGQHAVNPYVANHEALQALIAAHAKWKAEYYPDSPWFFPGHDRDADRPVDKGALAHALRRLHAKGLIKKKRISHGMRAWYVTVRRSHGATDAQIAHEIGHTSGGGTLGKVYGGVPPEWLSGGGPKMSWLPKGKPAWEAIKPPRTPRCQARSTGAAGECPPPALAA